MKLETDLKGNVVISGLVLGVTCQTSVGPLLDSLSICERDSGFEVRYHGQLVELKYGKVYVPKMKREETIEEELLREGPGNES